MSPCLRVRAGAQRFLLPSASVGRIGLPWPPAGEPSRVLDARRLDPDRTAAGRAPPIALEWRRPAFLVLVDAVDGIVDPDPHDLTDLPRALIGLGWFFDAAWYDREAGQFLLRVRSDAPAAGLGRRIADLVRRLGPLEGSAP